MMGYNFQAMRFHLFDGVIQEKIDEYGVDVPIRMTSQDLAPDQFDAPDATASQLNLPWMAVFYGFEVSDMGLEPGSVGDAAKGMEHLWYSVVCIIWLDKRPRRLRWIRDLPANIVTWSMSEKKP